jgi:hypothetical protein
LGYAGIANQALAQLRIIDGVFCERLDHVEQIFGATGLLSVSNGKIAGTNVIFLSFLEGRADQ